MEFDVTHKAANRQDGHTAKKLLVAFLWPSQRAHSRKPYGTTSQRVTIPNNTARRLQIGGKFSFRQMKDVWCAFGIIAKHPRPPACAGFTVLFLKQLFSFFRKMEWRNRRYL
jgi:hypothetical protein